MPPAIRRAGRLAGEAGAANEPRPRFPSDGSFITVSKAATRFGIPIKTLTRWVARSRRGETGGDGALEALRECLFIPPGEKFVFIRVERFVRWLETGDPGGNGAAGEDTGEAPLRP